MRPERSTPRKRDFDYEFRLMTPKGVIAQKGVVRTPNARDAAWAALAKALKRPETGWVVVTRNISLNRNAMTFDIARVDGRLALHQRVLTEAG